LTRYPLDVDLDEDGDIDILDLREVKNNYNVISSELEFVLVYDIGGDSEIDVRDIARIGFEWGTRPSV
jgi:hypothetical protein